MPRLLVLYRPIVSHFLWASFLQSAAGMTTPLTAAVLNELTSRIIAHAIAVHRVLGPGLLEHAYLRCLCYELDQAQLPFALQYPIPLVYKDVRLPCAYRADLIVGGAVLVEVKALETVAPIHLRQLSTYVRLADLRVGLLLNFGAQTLVEGIHRYANVFPESE